MAEEQKSQLRKLTEKGDQCVEPFISDPTKPTLMTLLKEYLATDQDMSMSLYEDEDEVESQQVLSD